MKIKFYLLVLLINFSLVAYSQEIEWQNTIGGSNWDYLNSVQQTSDGGFVLCGWSESNISGDKTENSNGAEDYWIIKTDAAGNIQWQNTIGGSAYENYCSAQQTSDGGYIIGGRSSSNISGDKAENSIGSSDYWIVKTDASGNIQWQNTIGGSYGEILFSIQQTTDGGYILGGTSSSNISGDKTENNIGLEDYWIVKTDSLGNIQWQNTIGGNDHDYLYSIQQTNDGGYILGGTSESDLSGDKTENSNGMEDYWIVKTDATGNIQWQNTIGGNSIDELHSIKQTADGGYILGGFSWSTISGDKTEECKGYSDHWIIKTDAGGNIQWQKTFGGNSNDDLYSIQQTADGGYIFGGESHSNISGDKVENTIGFQTGDYWIVKPDSSGNMQWQNTIGGSDWDEFRSIQQTVDGGYILGGMSLSSISGDKTENCIGQYDYWIVKLTDKYNLINGKLFIDLNSNQIQDINEPAVKNQLITESNTGRLAVSQRNGIYNLAVLDSGNFTVMPPNLNYYSSVPSSHMSNFSGIHQTDSLNDFAFQPLGVFNDLCITINPMGNFRAGFDASYMISYENVGTTTLNGTVIFFPDNDVTYVSANPTATSVTTDSVVWNVGSLTPFHTGSILVTVHVNSGTPIGTLINSNVEIDPVAGDANTACNYNSWEVFVTGGFDPNEILVDRDTVFTTELSSPPYLNYIIYFQNTGNDTAFNVKVLNPIDTFKLDLHSFEFISSSHPVNIEYKIWERNLHFTFDNILLPDSNINEPASHGFIRYRIKPISTLIASDSIKNNAAIYFDFNQPVMTDTAVTEIVLPTGEEEFKVQSLKFKVFPNPAREELIIKSDLLTGKNAEVKIYDLFGREVYKSESAFDGPKSEIKINVSGFSQGIYFIQLQSGKENLRAKFLKR